MLISNHLDKAFSNGVKLLLITKSVAQRQQHYLVKTTLLSHRNPYQTPPPSQTPTSLPWSPELAQPSDGGMRRDKPMVGLHQHIRLAKASRVTDRRSSGARWEWEQGRAAQTREAANLPPAGLLMPTICVCKSSPTGQEPQQAHTQVNKHPERAI